MHRLNDEPRPLSNTDTRTGGRREELVCSGVGQTDADVPSLWQSGDRIVLEPVVTGWPLTWMFGARMSRRRLTGNICRRGPGKQTNRKLRRTECDLLFPCPPPRSTAARNVSGSTCVQNARIKTADGRQPDAEQRTSRGLTNVDSWSLVTSVRSQEQVTADEMQDVPETFITYPTRATVNRYCHQNGCPVPSHNHTNAHPSP